MKKNSSTKNPHYEELNGWQKVLVHGVSTCFLLAVLGGFGWLLNSCSQMELVPKELLRETEYFMRCEKALSWKVSIPSKADYGLWEFTENGNRIVINGDVEYMNSFGVMLPHKFICVFEDDALIDDSLM